MERRQKTNSSFSPLFVSTVILFLLAVTGWLAAGLHAGDKATWWTAAPALAAAALAAAYLCLLGRRAGKRPLSSGQGARTEQSSAQATDSLTGLPDRIRLLEVMDFEIARSKRYRRPLSLVVVSIDHLGRIRRERGHAAAEAVLISAAGLLRGSLRKTDHLARLAEDEFAVVLTETEGTGAVNVAGKLCEAVRNRCCEDGDTVTASVGVAIAEEPDTVESFLNRGEAASMTARRSGGNRVATATF